LIAVNVFETYADVSKIVSREATSSAMLYRDISGYPEPMRSRLQAELRGYVFQVIHGAWPLQARGEVPTQGVEWMNRLQGLLLSFEPATEGQKLLHAETLRAYNNLIEARRMRVDAVLTHLPELMWIVIMAGAVISLCASFFFSVEDVRLHAVLVTLLATFIALVIFLTFAFDRPFMGDLGVSSDPYQRNGRLGGRQRRIMGESGHSAHCSELDAYYLGNRSSFGMHCLPRHRATD
jgi:hypothetical protein